MHAIHITYYSFYHISDIYFFVSGSLSTGDSIPSWYLSLAIFTFLSLDNRFFLAPLCAAWFVVEILMPYVGWWGCGRWTASSFAKYYVLGLIPSSQGSSLAWALCCFVYPQRPQIHLEILFVWGRNWFLQDFSQCPCSTFSFSFLHGSQRVMLAPALAHPHW